MNRTKLNVQSAMSRCRKSTNPIQSSLNQKGFTQPITKTPRRLTSTNTNVLPSFDTLTGLEQPHCSERTRKALVRSVAIVLGISLFLPMPAAIPAQLDPKRTAKTHAKSQIASTKQWSCLAKLWGKESAWNHLADNPYSTAFGIPQILGLKTVDPIKQVDIGLKYITHRYSNPCNAWSFHKRKGWY